VASHPYISGLGSVEQMIGYLRKNFPATVTSETVKKFSLAPNNESYVINALQFLGVIDEEGKRTEKGHDVFVLGDDDFPKAFEGLVRGAYKDLFDLRGDDAWSLPRKDLVSYFRTTDKTSEVIGGRQAGLFQTFAALAGHAATNGAASSGKSKSTAKPSQSKPKVTSKAATSKAPDPIIVTQQDDKGKSDGRKDMALTVRIEINLPANGTQETYDMIFKSIRANLINE
jgi:hypothetical protein